ncbi:MAG: hypothetical protein H6622_17355 [Halobacteriovoraceae bacterium]|nr:hypothetical protein [Halobacteriovoraceae bacterium]
MLCRKDQAEMPIMLPNEWRDKLSKLLASTYAKELEIKDSSFFVYGETYPDELILTIGIHSKSNTHLNPTTLIYSVNLEENSNPQKILDDLVDSSGHFLDVFFKTEDWEDYIPVWTEETFRNLSFFYKISRENIELFLKAEALLNQ